MTDLLQKQIFSILFASGDPIELQRVAQAAGVGPETAEEALSGLETSMKKAGIPLRLLRLGDKLQLSTQEEFAGVIRQALELRRAAPLSQAAMEVLAVVAYNQPVTRAFIEQVRGVDSSGVVNSLVEKQLIEEAGRMDLPGRPLSYRTTDNFLRCFQLKTLRDLPELPTPKEALPEGENGGESPAGGIKGGWTDELGQLGALGLGLPFGSFVVCAGVHRRPGSERPAGERLGGLAVSPVPAAARKTQIPGKETGRPEKKGGQEVTPPKE